MNVPVVAVWLVPDAGVGSWRFLLSWSPLCRTTGLPRFLISLHSNGSDLATIKERKAWKRTGTAEEVTGS